MQEPNRTRDKIEIKLEPRQVFVLAAGCMVFSGLLFSAGFMLGRTSPESVQPRAAADLMSQMTAAAPEGPAPVPTSAAVGEVEFLFPNALGSRPARRAAPTKAMRLPAGQVHVAASRTTAQKLGDVPKVKTAKPASQRTGAAAPPAEKELDEDFPLPKTLGSLGSSRPVQVKPSVKKGFEPPAKMEKTRSAEAPKLKRVAPPTAAVATTRPPAVEARKSTLTKRDVAQTDDEDLPQRQASQPVGTSALVPDRLVVKRLKPKDAVTTKAPAAVQKPARISPKNHRNGSPVFKSNGTFTLQVKAARTKARAQAFIKKLKGQGYEPHQVLVHLPGKGKFYRIRIGRFGTMEAARAFQKKYKRTSGATDAGFVTRM
ncbi:MAG: SPOR domain-containing protein [Myxococcota bacterium]|nr:SPOR domain-containing protein [Myxococcota bacterium]